MKIINTTIRAELTEGKKLYFATAKLSGKKATVTSMVHQPANFFRGRQPITKPKMIKHTESTITDNIYRKKTK